jgi:superfamily II DNA helicase RecQ
MKINSFKLRIDEPFNLSDLDEINDFISKVKVTKSVSQFVQKDIPYWSLVFFYEEKNEAYTNEPKILYPKDTPLNEEQQKIYNALSDWRNEVAKSLKVPQFYICHNSELITFSIIQPKEMNDFNKIKGWNGKKLEKYGEEIISIINAF